MTLAKEELKHHICIEGNIASGKTTLLQNLVKYFDEEHLEMHYKIVPECTIDTMDNSLEEYYKNPQRYAYDLQCNTFNRRLKELSIDEELIHDRSIIGDFIFAVANCILGNIHLDDFNEYAFTFRNEVLSGRHNFEIYFLDVHFTICHERCRERNRDCEQSVSLDYLCLLCRLHTLVMSPKSYLSFDSFLPIIEGKNLKKKVYHRLFEEIGNVHDYLYENVKIRRFNNQDNAIDYLIDQV